ncbi:MAG TPA: hypothetical protein VJ757_07285 [Pseudonocardiaceae bacterium]|nr:hypothetical protein [Pseudonocardiaceae bacterium]
MTPSSSADELRTRRRALWQVSLALLLIAVAATVALWPRTNDTAEPTTVFARRYPAPSG